MKAEKIMKIIVFICSVLIISNSAKCQEPSENNYKKAVFSYNLLGYLPHIDDGTSNLGLQVEYYLGNRKSIALHAGYLKGNEGGGNIFDWQEETSGYQVELEGRHYLGRGKIIDPLVLLFWFQIFQYQSRDLENAGYYLGLNSTFYHLDAKTYASDNFIQRNSFALHAKAGYQCFKKYGLLVDHGVGVGLQYLTNSARFEQGFFEPKGNHLYMSLQYQFRLGFGL